MTATVPPPPPPPAPLDVDPPAGSGEAWPAIRIRGLVKAYGNLRAVDGLDLDVPRGGVFGLIGPNGAGKTTTMLAVTTLLPYDAGSVQVLGHDPSSDPYGVRANVGWMPDFFGVYDGLTCAEYLDFFGAAYRLDAARRAAQVADLLELVNLAHKADADVAGLSRGMQQRLALARALVHDPQMLVLDEPASGLDPRARVELREILLELARRGRTILISSHILAELEEMCDRVGIIEAGRVLAQGTPDEIREQFSSAAIVSIRVVGGDEAYAAAREAALAAGAADARLAEGRLICEVPGGSEAAARLLAALVEAGIAVSDFREERGGLERLFLTVTKGVVS